MLSVADNRVTSLLSVCCGYEPPRRVGPPMAERRVLRFIYVRIVS